MLQLNLQFITFLQLSDWHQNGKIPKYTIVKHTTQKLIGPVLVWLSLLESGSSVYLHFQLVCAKTLRLTFWIQASVPASTTSMVK